MSGYDRWTRERDAALVIDHGLRVLTSDTPPLLKIWGPRATNPAVNFRFRSIQQREAYLLQYVERFDEQVAKREAARAERSTTTAAHANDIQPGHIFRYSWGYDQTNIQYFQVVEKHGRNVTVREIGQSVVPGSEGFMSEHVEPRLGHFLNDINGGSSPRTSGGKPFVKRVQFTNDGRAFLSFDFGWCELWRGGSSYQSHYA